MRRFALVSCAIELAASGGLIPEYCPRQCPDGKHFTGQSSAKCQPDKRGDVNCGCHRYEFSNECCEAARLELICCLSVAAYSHARLRVLPLCADLCPRGTWMGDSHHRGTRDKCHDLPRTTLPATDSRDREIAHSEPQDGKRQYPDAPPRKNKQAGREKSKRKAERGQKGRRRDESGDEESSSPPPPPSSSPARYALVLCGAVSLMYRSPRGVTRRSSLEASVAKPTVGVVIPSLYERSWRPTPVNITLSSLRQHVVDVNERVGGRFDFFVHSWAPDLESTFRNALNFSVVAFEDNQPYEASWAAGRMGPRDNATDWHQLSYALSISKAAELVLAHAQRMERFYDRIVFARADVLMTRDLRFAAMPASDQTIYVSGERKPALTARDRTSDGQTGDMHSVLSTIDQLRLFARLPDLLSKYHVPLVNHRWLWRALTTASPSLRIQTDGFREAIDEAVYRTLPHCPMRCRGQPFYQRYGVDEVEWAALQPMKELAECNGPKGELATWYAKKAVKAGSGTQKTEFHHPRTG